MMLETKISSIWYRNTLPLEFVNIIYSDVYAKICSCVTPDALLIISPFD